MIDLYRDRPDLYDLLHDDETADLAFYANFAAATVPPGGAILELGCGSGRIMEALLQRGYYVTGVDEEEVMLARARGRLARFGTRATLVAGDMRRLDLGETRFDLVVVAVNTFMHLRDHAEQRACLGGIRAHLAPGASAIIDVTNPFHVLALPQGTMTLRKQAYDAETGDAIVVTGSLEVDPTAPHVVDHLTFDRWGDDGVVRRLTSTVELRLLFMPELELLLTMSGLGISDAYGDYDLGPYQPGAERMIAIVGTYSE